MIPVADPVDPAVSATDPSATVGSAADSFGSDDLAAALQVVCDQSRVERFRPLGPLTTYRVGGPANIFIDVASARDLRAIATVVAHRRVPVSIVGRGSNLLVADAGHPGLVLHLGESFDTISDLGSGLMRLGGAAALPVAARQLTAGGLGGFEWAVGVPGSLGGAVRMNAGGHGADMAASVRRVRIVDLWRGDEYDLDAAELAFAYRSSSIEPAQLVVSADLVLSEGDPDRGQAMLREIVRWRRDHQPGGQNAGSVFTNPDGDSAGRLIDAAGLKGFRIGSAEVSRKHANFIQVDAGGTAADVVAVMRAVIRRVADTSGVTLHAETRMIGFGPVESSLMFDPQKEDR